MKFEWFEVVFGVVTLVLMYCWGGYRAMEFQSEGIQKRAIEVGYATYRNGDEFVFMNDTCAFIVTGERIGAAK